MAKKPKFKKNKGNYYAHDSEYAEEILNLNQRHDPYPKQQELNIQDR